MFRMSPRFAFACFLPSLALLLALPTLLLAQSPVPQRPAAPAEIGSVVLQPGPEGKDACGWLTYPTTNYGTSEWFYGIGIPYRTLGYLQFDLSAVPAGGVVTSAQLELWGAYNDGTLTFEPVATDWDEMTLTWTNLPEVVSPALAVTHPVSRGLPSGPCYWGCALSFDVTAIVAAWADGTITNRGFRILGDTLPVGWMMATSDNLTYARPKLTVTWDTSLPVANRTWGQLKSLYR